MATCDALPQLKQWASYKEPNLHDFILNRGAHHRHDYRECNVLGKSPDAYYSLMLSIRLVFALIPDAFIPTYSGQTQTKKSEFTTTTKPIILLRAGWRPDKVIGVVYPATVVRRL